MFGHTVKGPLKLLKEKWLAVGCSAPTNFLKYVSSFCSRLSRACELPKEVKSAQSKIKSRYNQKSKHRVFNSGDQVLLLLPIPGSVFQAQYNGTYIIDHKVGECNHLFKTPDRKQKSRLCHVKPYFDCCQTGFADVKALTVLKVSSTETEVDDAVSEVAQSRLPNSG